MNFHNSFTIIIYNSIIERVSHNRCYAEKGKSMVIDLTIEEVACIEAYLHVEIKNMQQYAFTEEFTKECTNFEKYYLTMKALSKIQKSMIEVLENDKRS